MSGVCSRRIEEPAQHIKVIAFDYVRCDEIFRLLDALQSY
jgi:hypothetical protein